MVAPAAEWWSGDECDEYDGDEASGEEPCAPGWPAGDVLPAAC